MVPISATRGTNVDQLVREICRMLPEGEPLYGPDMLTDRTERFLAAELVREQLFLRLKQELPYATAVVIESWQERADRGDVVIDALILVERDSQRGIVVGKGGTMIRDVGIAARKEIGDAARPAGAPEAGGQGRARLDHVAERAGAPGLRADEARAGAIAGRPPRTTARCRCARWSGAPTSASRRCSTAWSAGGRRWSRTCPA